MYVCMYPPPFERHGRAMITDYISTNEAEIMATPYPKMLEVFTPLKGS